MSEKIELPKPISDIKENEALLKMRSLVPTLVERAMSFRVDSEEKYQIGSKTDSYLGNRIKELEALRLHFKQPLTEAGRRIDSFFKAFIIPTKEARTIVKKKMGKYWSEQEAIREAAEEKARKEVEAREAEEQKLREAEEAKRKEIARLEAEGKAKEAAKAQKEAEKLAKEREEKKAVEIAPVIPETPIAEDTTVRKNWDFKVITESKVPRVYLSLDTQKVRSAIRDGVRDIPGLEIYQRIDIASK